MNPRLLAYRPRYYIFRPWKIIKEIYSNMRFSFQRSRRGWAECDAWNMDVYLAEIVAPMLKYLATTSHGRPAGFLIAQEIGENDEWKMYLNELANAFEEYLTIQQGSDCYILSAYMPVIEKMKRLFDYYPNLWS